MLAVVNQPRIEVRAPEIPDILLRFLRKTFGSVSVKKEAEPIEESANVFDSDWYKDISRRTTPGETVKICRSLFGITQAELASRLRIPSQNVSAIENNHRSITKQMAEKLSDAFNGGVPPDAFYYYTA